MLLLNGASSLGRFEPADIVSVGFKEIMMSSTPPTISSLFPLGEAVITRNAKNFLDERGIDPLPYLTRHANGDWSEMSREDQVTNRNAIRDGFRIFSSYNLPIDGISLWIITEADRSSTTILLPDDY